MIYLIRFKRQHRLLPFVGINVGDAFGAHTDNLSGAEQFNQLAGAFKRREHAFRIKVLLKAAARFGPHSERSRSHPDGRAVEVGALEDDIFGSFGNLRVLTAHDAGKRHRFLFVGDD